MEKNEFARLENLCQFRFEEAGDCFHVCSRENHPVLFRTEDDFKTAMNVVAFASLMCSDLKIYTFEIMDNHLHFAMSGQRSRIEMFLHILVAKLASRPELATSSGDIKGLSFDIYQIDSVGNLRNVIAYVNRNGPVINPDESVFTYKWGANRYFFNPEALLRFKDCGKITTFRERRLLFRSDDFSCEKPIIVLDGYVSPLCYCSISEAQNFFPSNRHYFYSVSRNIEASLSVAKIIGERIFYSDTDLFAHITSKCSKEYNCSTISSLSKESKIELARELHFNYNAGNKQICRLLKLDMTVVSALFPGKD